jgi:hypothetical protein
MKKSLIVFFLLPLLLVGCTPAEKTLTTEEAKEEAATLAASYDETTLFNRQKMMFVSKEDNAVVNGGKSKEKRIFAYDKDASYIYEEWTRTDYSATGAEKTGYRNLWGLMIYQGKKIRFAMGTPLTNERVYWEVSDSEFSKAFEEFILNIIWDGFAFYAFGFGRSIKGIAEHGSDPYKLNSETLSNDHFASSGAGNLSYQEHRGCEAPSFALTETNTYHWEKSLPSHFESACQTNRTFSSDGGQVAYNTTSQRENTFTFDSAKPYEADFSHDTFVSSSL